MLSVMIVDDEEKVCKLIYHLIDWQALELEVVGILNDGKSAYEAVCEKSPDIYFIIISGYSHFEYAQNAIKYGVEEEYAKKEALVLLLEKIQSMVLEKLEEHCFEMVTAIYQSEIIFFLNRKEAK